MKNISDMFTNVFLLSPETFYPAFILHSPLSTLFPLCPLAILPNILVHDGCRKKQSGSSAPNQTSRSLVWLQNFLLWD